MNEEEKQIAQKSQRLAASFGDVMEHLKLTGDEECSVIMNLLCVHLVKKKEDPERFLKWISKAIPVVIENWSEGGYGYVSGTSKNTKIEFRDK